ncbi:virion core protein [Bovine papular stomatitis virus]
MASDRIAQRAQSSYDDYIQTLNKIAPQLRNLLSHLNSDHAVRGGATGAEACAGGSLEAVSSRRGSSTARTKSRTTRSSTKTASSSSKSRRNGAPGRRGDGGGGSIAFSGMRACDAETVQAVSNCGRIVYGVMKDGKLEVHGTMGDVCEDLLGVDCVNAGRKNASRRTKSSGTGTCASSSSSSASRRRTPGAASSSSSTTPRRRRAPALSAMNSAVDLDGGMC